MEKWLEKEQNKKNQKYTPLSNPECLWRTASANLNWRASVLNSLWHYTHWCMHTHLHTEVVRVIKMSSGSMFSSSQTSLSASAIQTDCLPTPNDYWLHIYTDKEHTLKTKRHSDTQTNKHSHITGWHWVESTPSPKLCNCCTVPAPHVEFSQRLTISSMLHYPFVSHVGVNIQYVHASTWNETLDMPVLISRHF